MSFPKLFVVGPLRVASFACAKAPIKEPPFHRVARQSERRAEMLARRLASPTAQLKLAECSGVEGIGGESITVGDGEDLFEPTLGTLVLCHRDGAIERDNR